MQYTYRMATRDQAETYQEIIQRNLRTDPDTGERESWRACVTRMSTSAVLLPRAVAELAEAQRDIERVVDQCRREAAARRRAQRIQGKMGLGLFVTGALCVCGWAWALYLLPR